MSAIETGASIVALALAGTVLVVGSVVALPDAKALVRDLLAKWDAREERLFGEEKPGRGSDQFHGWKP